MQLQEAGTIDAKTGKQWQARPRRASWLANGSHRGRSAHVAVLYDVASSTALDRGQLGRGYHQDDHDHYPEACMHVQRTGSDAAQLSSQHTLRNMASKNRNTLPQSSTAPSPNTAQAGLRAAAT